MRRYRPPGRTAPPRDDSSTGGLLIRNATRIGRRAWGIHRPRRAVSASFIPVLLYHAVGEPARAGLERFTLSEAGFAAHLQALSAHRDGGATPMLVGPLADGLRGVRPLPDRPFAVTFDDGYDDNLAAIRALADAGIPSTIYVTSSFVGRPGMLSAAEVRELAQHPLVEVGAHAVHHVRLDELSRQEIVREVGGGRRQLQEITGYGIDSIAYPHGAYDGRVLEEVRGAGYSSGAAVKNALSRPGDDPLAIARWTVLDSHGPDDVRRVLDGQLATVGTSERLRTRGYRVVRRTRRRFRVLTGRAV
jgi:peptidoglycan/xylan/chitin deacetylase (PgdA/CDA1 family)